MEEIISGATGVPSNADVMVNGPQFSYTVPINAGTITVSGTGTAIATLPATIAAAGTYTSNVIPSYGARHFAAAAEMTTAGSLIVNRYLDTLGSISVGGTFAATGVALSASTQANIDNADGRLFQSLSFELINSGSVAGTLSVATLVLQS